MCKGYQPISHLPSPVALIGAVIIKPKVESESVVNYYELRTRFERSIEHLKQSVESSAQELRGLPDSVRNSLFLELPDANLACETLSLMNPRIDIGAVDGSYGTVQLEGLTALSALACGVRCSLDLSKQRPDLRTHFNPLTLEYVEYVPQFRLGGQAEEILQEVMRYLEYLYLSKHLGGPAIIFRDGSISTDFRVLVSSALRSAATQRFQLFTAGLGCPISAFDVYISLSESFDTSIGGNRDEASGAGATATKFPGRMSVPPGRALGRRSGEENSDILNSVLREMGITRTESTLASDMVAAKSRIESYRQVMRETILSGELLHNCFLVKEAQGETISKIIEAVRYASLLELLSVIRERTDRVLQIVSVSKDSGSSEFQAQIFESALSSSTSGSFLPDKVVLSFGSASVGGGKDGRRWRTIAFDPLIGTHQTGSSDLLRLAHGRTNFNRFLYQLDSSGRGYADVFTCDYVTQSNGSPLHRQSKGVVSFHDKSKLADIVSSLLVCVSIHAGGIPEGLGHVYPLLLADRLAKLKSRNTLRAIDGFRSVPLTRSDLREISRVTQSFRLKRSSYESTRRKRRR